MIFAALFFQEQKVSHLKDLIHIIFDPEAQAMDGIPFIMCYATSKYPILLHKEGHVKTEVTSTVTKKWSMLQSCTYLFFYNSTAI